MAAGAGKSGGTLCKAAADSDLDSCHQLRWCEGLDDVVGGSKLKGPVHVLAAAVPGHADDGSIGSFADSLHQLEPVSAL